MIDIHCHILPGVDDGAKDLAESLEMAKTAVNQGITTIIATPHHLNNAYENRKPQILQQATELNKALDSANIPLTILPGQEIRIYGEILEDYHKQEILPLVGSNYLLIELPSGHVPRYTEKMLYDLQLQGFIPIIAHPERNREINQHPEILYQLVKKGALTQVTAASICGAFGKKIKTFSQQLIESNLTHFIASDAHNLSNRRFLLAEAYAEIEVRYGNDMVYLFKENGELLVSGKSVFKEVPQLVVRRKFLGIF
jgi:protein-tyrosine phosphatase